MGCTGKANTRIRHMQREHIADPNPMCALRAPFVWQTFDSLFYLCRPRKVRTQVPNEPGCDNPSVLTQMTTRREGIRVT